MNLKKRMNDIGSRKDIDILVQAFYQKAMHDPLIRHFFTNVVKLDLKHHLPVIVSFWEGILLHATTYKGNPMIKHIELSRKSKIERKHFDRWLKLWKSTVDLHFSGEIADVAKNRAKQIAELMLHKIETNP